MPRRPAGAVGRWLATGDARDVETSYETRWLLDLSDPLTVFNEKLGKNNTAWWCNHLEKYESQWEG